MPGQPDYRITAQLAGIETPVIRFDWQEHLSEPFLGQLAVYDTGYTQSPLSAKALLDKTALICSGLITSHQMKGVTTCSIKRKRDPNNAKATLSC